LLKVPRTTEWKRKRMPLDRFLLLLEQLDSLGSVREVVLSGMGEPLTHPDVYRMIAAIKERGWGLMIITNLLAADIEALAMSGVDQLLVGVQGVSPDSYAAFHPGWNEVHFFKLCAHLRRLQRTKIRVRHVQVIDRNTAPEVVEMVSFAQSFGAERLNYKLASLAEGTEATALTEAQRSWLLEAGLAEAAAQAERQKVNTNLSLFEQQLRSGGRSTAPIAEIGCAMGYVYTRITVEEEAPQQVADTTVLRQINAVTNAAQAIEDPNDVYARLNNAESAEEIINMINGF
jgi:MoaA/NifB/PqqE/SkfB family radical SAM enzyme